MPVEAAVPFVQLVQEGMLHLGREPRMMGTGARVSIGFAPRDWGEGEAACFKVPLHYP